MHVTRLLTVPVLAVSLASGCSGARAGPQQTQSARSAQSAPSAAARPAGVRAASVDVAALMAAHPFYETLRQYDREIAALRATETIPGLTNNAAAFDHDTAALRNDLTGAAAHMRSLAALQANDNERREDDAVTALLAATDDSAANGQTIGAQVQQDYRSQYAALRGNAETDMARYRDAVLTQERSALAAFAHTILNGTQRAYNARSQQFAEKEAALDMDVVRQQAAERLSLRLRLQNLALTRSERANILGELKALNDSEGDAVAVQHRQDAAALAQFRNRLRTRARTAYKNTSKELQARSAANLAARARVFRVQVAAASGPPQNIVGSPAAMSSMHAQVEEFHRADSGHFRSGALAMSSAFGSARDDLLARFTRLHDEDAAVRRDAHSQIAALKRDREALRGEIAAAIMRDARRAARAHGLSAVYPSNTAPRGSLDLTSAVRADFAAFTR
ncbi:hypothetical protein EPN42_07910 [bacterium]|nr:MAG: hypothetical protein EPN42_07910 [bacterium]